MKLSKRSSFFLITMLLISCARYPTIPILEEIDPTRALPPLPKLSQEKSTALLPEREAKQKDYVIGPEDVLVIQVWDHPDMDREVHVSREGEFSYPLIGKVHADGLTVVELEKEITGRLDIIYIINPQVNVVVKQLRSKHYYVFGEVEKPGKFLHEKGITVLKALTIAGGITDVASVKRTKIVREKEGRRVQLKVQMNDEVMPEDIIVVPESFF